MRQGLNSPTVTLCSVALKTHKKVCLYALGQLVTSTA